MVGCKYVDFWFGSYFSYKEFLNLFKIWKIDMFHILYVESLVLTLDFYNYSENKSMVSQGWRINL